MRVSCFEKQKVVLVAAIAGPEIRRDVLSKDVNGMPMSVHRWSENARRNPNGLSHNIAVFFLLGRGRISYTVDPVWFGGKTAHQLEALHKLSAGGGVHKSWDFMSNSRNHMATKFEINRPLKTGIELYRRKWDLETSPPAVLYINK